MPLEGKMTDSDWNRWTDYISDRIPDMTKEEWENIDTVTDLFYPDMTDEEERELARKAARMANEYAKKKELPKRPG